MSIIDDYKQLQMIENIKNLKEKEMAYKSNLKLCKYQEQQINKLATCIEQIKEIAEPYKITIKKICGNCKKYDDCHACCYKYTSAETNACEEFTYLDEFVPNILAKQILQKISECEAKNE